MLSKQCEFLMSYCYHSKLITASVTPIFHSRDEVHLEFVYKWTDTGSNICTHPDTLF